MTASEWKTATAEAWARRSGDDDVRDWIQGLGNGNAQLTTDEVNGEWRCFNQLVEEVLQDARKGKDCRQHPIRTRMNGSFLEMQRIVVSQGDGRKFITIRERRLRRLLGRIAEHRRTEDEEMAYRLEELIAATHIQGLDIYGRPYKADLETEAEMLLQLAEDNRKAANIQSSENRMRTSEKENHRWLRPTG